MKNTVGIAFSFAHTFYFLVSRQTNKIVGTPENILMGTYLGSLTHARTIVLRVNFVSFFVLSLTMYVVRK